MTNQQRSAIIRRYDHLETVARKTMRGPDYDEITDTVANEFDVPSIDVNRIVLDAWNTMGAG